MNPANGHSLPSGQYPPPHVMYQPPQQPLINPRIPDNGRMQPPFNGNYPAKPVKPAPMMNLMPHPSQMPHQYPHNPAIGSNYNSVGQIPQMNYFQPPIPPGHKNGHFDTVVPEPEFRPMIKRESSQISENIDTFTEDQDPLAKEQKQKKVTEKIDKLNKEFLDTREKIYKDKLKMLREEISEIHQKTHHEYVQEIQKLEIERDEQINWAEMFRNWQLECCKMLYEAEVQSSLVEFQQEKEGLKAKIASQIEDKKRKLKEQKDSFDFEAEEALEQKTFGTRKTTRQMAVQSRMEDRRGGKKAKAVNAAVLPFLLKENFVLDDLALIRKTISSMPLASRKMPPKAAKR